MRGIPAADTDCCPAPHLDWLDGLIPQMNFLKLLILENSSDELKIVLPAPHLACFDGLIPQMNFLKTSDCLWFNFFEEEKILPPFFGFKKKLWYVFPLQFLKLLKLLKLMKLYSEPSEFFVLVNFTESSKPSETRELGDRYSRLSWLSWVKSGLQILR